MSRRRIAVATALTTVALAAPGGDLTAGSDPPQVTVVEQWTFDQPVDLAWRNGDSGRYVVEQGGRVQRVDADDPDAEPRTVLDISDLVSTGNEQGLLGLAFSPDGANAYLNYTDLAGHTVIAEHPVDEDGTFGDGDLARTVMYVEQPYANHNGGDLAFGPDGYLYIGLGDGGSAGDPDRRATDPAQLLGKLLRIDPAITAGEPYSIPADNPFVDSTEPGAPEVWALGLRNPWRFSFDAETGDLWIADVGQGDVEEIDAVPAVEGVDAGRGAHFGWSAFEGDDPFNTDVTVTDPVAPVFTYRHDEGCAVAGGVRARGPASGSLAGWYVYGDYCATTLWALQVTDGEEGPRVEARVEIGDPVSAITAVVAGPEGEIYALRLDGPVSRLDAG